MKEPLSDEKAAGAHHTKGVRPTGWELKWRMAPRDETVYRLLLEEMACGDPTAHELFWEEFDPKLKFFLLKELRDQECMVDATTREDLEQNIRAKISTKGAESFRGKSKVSTWLYAYVVHEVNELKRAHKRHPWNELAAHELRCEGRASRSAGDVATEELLSDMRDESLQEALHYLEHKTPDSFEVIYRYYYKEESLRKIARATGKSRRRVKNLWDQGHTILKKALTNKKKEVSK